MSSHEDYSRSVETEQSSERGLGIVFGSVCILVGLWRLYHQYGGVFRWFAAAAIFFALAYFWTAPLRPLNALWRRFGLLLFKITNPLITGLMFFVTVAPTGLILRAFGKDPLQLKKNAAADSYWQVRNPPGPAGHEMNNQF